jgi:BASS family bile acid:Na+ symporter
MKPALDVVIPAVTFLLMAVVGLDLTPADFDRVRRRPGTVVAGLLGPLLLLPPVALALIHWLRPAPEIQAGLLLIVSCPVGGISNTYSYLARASTALSVTLTAISCLAAVVTMPLLTRFFALALHRPFGASVPVGLLMGQLLVMLVAPVGLGMIVRRRAPAFARRHELRLRLAALGALAALLLFVVAHESRRFAADVAATAPLAAALVLTAMLAGLLVGRLLRAGPQDCFTLAVEFSTRNVAIATAIAITLLGQVRFAVFATTYFLIEAPLMLVAIAVFRRITARHTMAARPG